MLRFRICGYFLYLLFYELLLILIIKDIYSKKTTKETQISVYI